MLYRKQLFVAYFLLFAFNFCSAQIEVAHVTVKKFSAIGFGGFLNFSIPVSEANYVTLEGGLQYFKNKDDEELGLFPVLVGYRYTLDKSGSGFYVEPNAGYTFGGSTIDVYTENGGYTEDVEKITGPAAGVGVGYLVDLGNIPFNFGLRYEHTFGNAAVNVFAFRISHALRLGRKRED